METRPPEDREPQPLQTPPAQPQSQQQPNRSNPPPPPPRPHPGPELPPHFILEFGRLDSDYHIVDIGVNIAAQASLARATYHQLVQLTTVDLPISEENFLRMWRTLILKRVQDVYENEKRQRADHYVRLHRNILVPGPLGDLLYQLGACHSQANGVLYHLIPPAYPAAPPSWWAIDQAVLATWIQTMLRFRDIFTMKEFPSAIDIEGRPMCLTAIEDTNQQRRVIARTNDPKPVDAYIRFMNDELYEPAPNSATCHLLMTERLHLVSVRAAYIGRFVQASRA